jgi:hypothetical protein
VNNHSDYSAEKFVLFSILVLENSAPIVVVVRSWNQLLGRSRLAQYLSAALSPKLGRIFQRLHAPLTGHAIRLTNR